MELGQCVVGGWHSGPWGPQRLDSETCGLQSHEARACSPKGQGAAQVRGYRPTTYQEPRSGSNECWGAWGWPPVQTLLPCAFLPVSGSLTSPVNESIGWDSQS